VSDLEPLVVFLRRVPAIQSSIASGVFEDSRWWVKFAIDIEDELAWRVVQELGHVLNYLSPNDRLPTVFMPVSPPTYLNGGPKDYLSWVIESQDADFAPSDCVEWLEGRLPQPVDVADAWNDDDDD
jgi:hypothetical protein